MVPTSYSLRNPAKLLQPKKITTTYGFIANLYTCAKSWDDLFPTLGNIVECDVFKTSLKICEKSVDHLIYSFTNEYASRSLKSSSAILHVTIPCIYVIHIVNLYFDRLSIFPLFFIQIIHNGNFALYIFVPFCRALAMDNVVCCTYTTLNKVLSHLNGLHSVKPRG